MAKGSLSLTPAHSNRATYPNKKHPNEVAPDDCPDVYASICKGACLEPTFADGVCLVFSKLAPCQDGDFVGIWLRPDIPQADELPRRVKRLGMGLPHGFAFPFRPASGNELVPLVALEQLNPPRSFLIPATHIIAMHKVVGTAIEQGNGMARMIPFQDTDTDHQ